MRERRVPQRGPSWTVDLPLGASAGLRPASYLHLHAPPVVAALGSLLEVASAAQLDAASDALMYSTARSAAVVFAGALLASNNAASAVALAA